MHFDEQLARGLILADQLAISRPAGQVVFPAAFGIGDEGHEPGFQVGRLDLAQQPPRAQTHFGVTLFERPLEQGPGRDAQSGEPGRGRLPLAERVIAKLLDERDQFRRESIRRRLDGDARTAHRRTNT